MSGFGNFISQNIFGRSNAPVGVNPAQGQSTYKNGQSQLAQPANNNAGTLNGNTGAADATGGANNNADQNKGAQGSQLDSFKDLFTIATNDKGEPIAPPSDPLAAPIMNIDPAKMQEAVKNVNFAQGLTAEQVQQAMQDPQAFLAVINHVGRQSFQQAITVTSKMAEQAIQTNNQRFEQALPDRIRNVQIRQSSAKNPVLNHPAAAPVLEGIRMSIAAKNPQLSPDRVNDMAENYFMAMHEDMNAANAATAAAAAPKTDGPNWAELLNIPKQGA